MEELDYTVTNVQSLQALQDDLSRGGDIRMIVAAVQLPEYRSAALVRLVRDHPNGKNVPIAFYRKSISGVELEPWDPYSGEYRQPNTAAAYAKVLFDIERTQTLPPLTALDRKIYRDLARDALSDWPQG